MSVEKEIITLLTRAARATASLAEKSLVFAHYSLEYSEQQEHLKQQREVSAHLRRSVSQFESMEQSAEAHVVVAAEEAAAAATEVVLQKSQGVEEGERTEAAVMQMEDSTFALFEQFR